jgi:signal transduction histidine kinase/ligand-binding sensor domain-containing protein
VPVRLIRLIRASLLVALLAGYSAQPVFSATNAPAWLTLAWSSDDGLPNNTVGGIAQTVDGYLWLGTPNGLTRFDGLQFEDFPMTNFIALPNRGILTMSTGRGGDLHLGMDRGAIVSLSSGHKRVVLPDSDSSRLTINALTEDSQGTLWVGYRGGSVGRIEDGRLTMFDAENGLPSGVDICSLTCDLKGRLWFSKAGHLGIWRDGKFETLKKIERAPARLTPARSGGVWICSNFHLYKFDEGGELQDFGKFEPRLPSEPTVIRESRDGSVWIATTFSGLYRFTGESFETIPTSYQEILSLLEDAEGNMWVGSGGGGLNQVKPRAVSLESADSGLPFSAVQSLCEDTNGVVWAATQNGALAKKTDGRWQVIPIDSTWTGDATVVCADPNGDVWVGTKFHRLLCWRKDRFVDWGDVSQIKGQTIHTLVVATNGDLWVAEETPAAIQRLRNGRVDNFEFPPEILPADLRVVRASAQDAAGTIWFGTSAGVLLRVDGDRLVDETAKMTGAPQSIRCLYATPDGSLWIGFAGWGVGRIKDGRFSMINSRQGFPDDFISQIVADDQGRLWFGGDRGIFKVAQKEMHDVAEGKLPRVHSARYGPGSYGQSDGRPSLQACFGNSPISLRSCDGRLWLAMRTALAVIDPGKLRESSSSPTVLVTRMTVGEQPVAAYGGVVPPPKSPQGPILDLSQAHEGMRLPPDHRRIEFEYTALSFVGGENITFSYQLDGVDEDWTETRERKAMYPRLPAGDYEFRVKACNSEGVWNDLGATISFKVLPFFWNTWWFRSVALGAFTAIIIAFVRYVSLRRIRLRLNQLEAQAVLHKERARIAKDIHDDLGASLTQISLLGELAHQDRIEPEKVSTYINRISTTARYAVKSLDEIVWAVNPRNDTLAHFIDYTGQYALDYLRLAGVRCRLNLPDHVPARELSTDVRHNLFLVVKEAINNTVKYAHASELRLNVLVTDEKMELIIEDNGVGFSPPADDPGADGLRNMDQRMSDIGGHCWIQGRPGAGAKITLELPWSQNGAKPTG